ncbi:AAA family ATPase (plasmid) [Halorussus salilacus]|uniref:archaea-specific SMC-related protein n=1 Tax=Halorussus salilacus TaxID=2953750 RepID=UPI00209C7575|nr:archaea-specific SMC-related protein [Halorussus salilacus]USZ70142.1 AAA family ATPase [Halorussus salilacus]
MTELSLQVRNIGGIEALEATFEDGVVLVAGPNASNKTSLLKALSFALGSDDVPIRSGAACAEVTLSYGDRTVVRTAERNGAGVSISGDPWIPGDDSDALVTFATLLEFNPLRAAVRNGRPFEEALKAPLDLESLEAERSAKMSEKRDLQDRLSRLDGVESEFDRVREELSSKRDRIEELERELDSLEERRSDSTDSDEELDRLREKRAKLVGERDTQRRRVETTEDAISRLEDELEQVDDRIAEAEERVAGHDVESLRAEKEQLQQSVAERRDRVEVLQSVLTANREMLNSDFTGVVGRERTLMGDTYSCWACGQEAADSDFEETLEDLVELVEEDREKLDEYRPRIRELESEIEAARDAESSLRERRDQRQDIEDSLAERRESLEVQRERLREVESDLRDVTADIEEHERERADTESDIASEIEDVRVTLQTVQNEVDRLEDRREELTERVEERRNLRDDVEALRSEITELTQRIENAEQELRTSFNETMDDLVGLLGFERIQRIWLDGDFELVIARETDGSVQRESVEHLAESERELIGLVLGLAGYLTYDLPEQVPMLALDSFGAFDISRAQRLLEYISDVAGHVLVAVHPDRAAELDFPVSEVTAFLTSQA